VPEEAWVVVGTIGRAHGLKGEVEVVTGSDEPLRLGPPSVYPHPDGGVLTARAVRRHHQRVLLAFDEVTDRTGAEALKGLELRIPGTERRRLPTDEWWPEDLVGLTVVDPGGIEVGVVVDVVVGGPQDRLVVETPAGRREVPFVAALVPEVDVLGGVVVVEAPDGLW